MKEFNFCVDKADINLNKSKFNTTINLENNKINIMQDRQNGGYNRKLNSFTEGENDFYISDILSIKYKIGFAIALNIQHIINILLLIVAFGAELMNIENLWNQIKQGTITNILEINLLPHFIFIAGFFLIMQDITAKCIQITIKDDYNKYKKIIFPVASIFFIKTPKTVRDEIRELINELKNINPEIKYKEDNKHRTFIIFILACILTIILGGIVLKNNYKSENDVAYNLENNLLNENVIFDKGTLINIKKQLINGKDEYIYVFKIRSTGEEIEVKNQYGKQIGETYNICIIEYYDKKQNELFSREYKISYNNDNTIIQWGTNKEYLHDYIGNKTYIFNILENSDIPNYCTITSYYNGYEKGMLYNFIHSDEVKINIDNNIDVESIKNNKYITLEKIEEYESVYGTCYILKAEKK